MTALRPYASGDAQWRELEAKSVETRRFWGSLRAGSASVHPSRHMHQNSRQRHSVGKTRMNQPFEHGNRTTHLWWNHGWFILLPPALRQIFLGAVAFGRTDDRRSSPTRHCDPWRGSSAHPTPQMVTSRRDMAEWGCLMGDGSIRRKKTIGKSSLEDRWR